MIFRGILLALYSAILGQFLRLEIGGGGILFLDIFIPILFGFWGITKIQNNTNPWIQAKKHPLFWSGLLVIILFLISLLVNSMYITPKEIFESGFYLFRYTFLFLFGLVVFDEVNKNIKKQKSLILHCVIIAVILAIFGFIQLFIYPDFAKMAEKGWDPHIGRLLSTWFDPNFLGSFFSFILVILAGIFSVTYKNHLSLLHTYLQNKSALYKRLITKIFPNHTDNLKRQRYNNKTITIFFAITFILLIALSLTYSRSAQLAFVLPIFFIGLVYFRSILIISILGVLMILPFSPRASERIMDGINSAVSITEENPMFVPDPTARLRVENFQQGTQLATDNFWTGIGFNTIRLYKTQNIHSAGGFDSSLLTVLVTSGIFGFTAFLFFYFHAAKLILIRFLDSRDTIKKGICVGTLFSFLGIFAQSFFINSLFFSFFMIFVFAVFAVCLAEEE